MVTLTNTVPSNPAPSQPKPDGTVVRRGKIIYDEKGRPIGKTETVVSTGETKTTIEPGKTPAPGTRIGNVYYGTKEQYASDVGSTVGVSGKSQKEINKELIKKAESLRQGQTLNVRLPGDKLIDTNLNKQITQQEQAQKKLLGDNYVKLYQSRIDDRQSINPYINNINYKMGNIQNIQYYKQEKLKPLDELTKRARQLEYKSQQQSGFKRQELALGALGLGVVTGAGKILSPFRLKENIVGTYQFIKKGVTDPFGLGSEIKQELTVSPGTFIGEQIGTSIAIPGVVKGLEYGKGVYIKTGAKYIAPEKKFASEVLTGKSNLPLTGSIEQSLSEFKKTKSQDTGLIKVSTAAPAPLKSTEVGLGRKGGVGLEDPGIYVTPAGKGSPYFLRIGSNVPKEGISFNPFKGTFDIPTITELVAKDVSRQPKQVLMQPGFSATAEFLGKQGEAQKGMVFITKRSEIGQGQIPKTKYQIQEDVKLPMKSITVERAGKKVTLKEGQMLKKGDIVSPAGTSELEAVIPPKQKFRYQLTEYPDIIGIGGETIKQKVPLSAKISKLKGFEEYTLFEGKPVAIKKGELITRTSIEDVFFKTETKISNKIKEGTTETLSKEQRKLSESFTTKKVKYPLISVTSRKSLSSQISVTSKPSKVSRTNIISITKIPSKVYEPSKISKLNIASNISTPSKISRISITSKPSTTNVRSLTSIISKPSKISKSNITSVTSIPSTALKQFIKEPPRSEDNILFGTPKSISSQAYNTYIKQKQLKLAKKKYKSQGFTKANKEPLTKEAAQGLGATIVDEYANRSFTVRKATGKTKPRPDLENAWRNKSSKFKFSKKNPTVFVERSRFAIDSPNEIRGIVWESVKQRSTKFSLI